MRLGAIIPVDVWVPRFTAKLGVIRPGLTAEQIHDAALETYHETADLEPEEAAAVYATEPPPADCAAPGG